MSNRQLDKCAYNYDGVHYGPGTTGLPNNGLGLYNQVANGGEYLMQTEFSNHNSNGSTTGCVGKNTDTQPVVTLTITPSTPTHGVSAQFKANITDLAGVSGPVDVRRRHRGHRQPGEPHLRDRGSEGAQRDRDRRGNQKRVARTVTAS